MSSYSVRGPPFAYKLLNSSYVCTLVIPKTPVNKSFIQSQPTFGVHQSCMEIVGCTRLRCAFVFGIFHLYFVFQTCEGMIDMSVSRVCFAWNEGMYYFLFS